MHSVGKNLYRFYQFLGSAENVEYILGDGFEVLMSEKNLGTAHF